MRGARASVVHIITRLELGGAQQNTLYTCEFLDRERFDVHLVYGEGGLLDADARLMEHVSLYPLGSLVREISPRDDLAATTEIATVLRQVRERTGLPLIVHTHSSKAGIVGRAAARLAGADVVIHSVHGFGFDVAGHSPMRAVLVGAEKLAARVTDHFITVSKATQAQGVALGLFTAANSSVIYSGIRLERFRLPDRLASDQRAAVRAELGIPADAPLAGMVGNFKPQKSPLDFVEACALALKRVPGAYFVFAGDGELRAEVEARVQALGLTGRLKLLGWRRDIPRVMAALDVLVLTSRWEGLPRVIPQAMAAGKPVVATAVDGSVEAVTEGVTGYLCPPGDYRRIAARMVDLLRDLPTAQKMGAAGRERVAPWDINDMVRQQEKLYERLLTARLPHPGPPRQ